MKKFFHILIIVFVLSAVADASNIEGTKTYKDYLFILVHGMNGGSHHFNGQDNRDKELKLQQYLENDLGLKGRVYAYSFKNKNGSAIVNAREFGDRSYKFSANYVDENGDTQQLNDTCWLEKAREDFRIWFKNQGPGRYPREEEIPSKYIVVTHSFGNMAARLYIYSPQMGSSWWQESCPDAPAIWNGFYRNDIAKVVFIAPPFTGSDMAYAALMPKVLFQGYLAYDKVINEQSIFRILFQNIFGGNFNFLYDPYAPYKIAKEASFVVIDWYMFYDNLCGLVGVNPNTLQRDRQPDLLEGGGYGMFNPGTWQLIPEFWYDAFNPLLSVKYNDPAKEPAYSVIYGTGGPVLSFNDVIKNDVLGFLSKCSATSITSNIPLSDITPTADLAYNTSKFINELGPEINLLMPGSGFYNLSTAQAKFASLVMSNGLVHFSEDGDSAVPVHSAKGLYEDKLTGGMHSTKHLENANFYSKTYKGKFNAFLENELPSYVAGAVAAYGGMRLVGVPHEVALAVCEWSMAGLIIGKVAENKDDIWFNHFSHTNSLLKEYDMVKTAILDTPAIFTVQDLQTTAEAKGSSEATALSFTVSSPEAGFHSIKVMGVTESRQYSGTTSMPVPMTLKVLSASATPVGMSPASEEGERKYVTQMTVTKPPARIAGKLNYLVPKLMRSFEYSFNFAAWKPIENVNPETGEFILENLPFAEGQNVIAIRAENAVGVKSHQLMKIVLNTIPLVASELFPLPGTHTKASQPTIKGKFAKASYSGDPLENISLTMVKLITVRGRGQEGSIEAQGGEEGEEWDVTEKVKTAIGGGAYDKYLWFEYTPDEPLSDGQYSLVAAVDSNVGASQAVIDFIVDTQAPTIAIQPLQPYSPRAPSTIRWIASDEASPNLLSVHCDLYKESNQSTVTSNQDKYATNIATAESLSKGDNFFTLNPGNLETLIPDGNYKVKLTLSDLAGNQATAEQPITIDGTLPSILGVDISPNPMTGKTSEMGVSARVNENSQVIIKMINTGDNSTAAYLTQTNLIAGNGLPATGYLATYTWKYGDMFTKGPEDGIYRVEVSARDGAGNESLPRTLEGVVIDRAPPRIYGQTANPYVLSNTGKDAYKTKLSYRIISNVQFPCPSGRRAMSNEKQAGEVGVKIKIYNANTGALVDTIPAAPSSVDGENKITWDGSSPSLPKGAYRFQIIAEDKYGNIGTAYTSCVKDGIAPEITYPADDNSEISGTISIRGTAIDPDWTNNKPFKNYRVYYKKGQASPVTNPGSDWSTDFIEVPQVNRNPADPKNVSIRPLQNNSTLAYLYTNNLENGDYTVLVIADENGGESVAAARGIKVNNDSLTASSIQTPYVKLKSLPSSIEFKSDNSVKLPLGFINSVKPANVYVEILKVSRGQGIEVSSDISSSKLYPDSHIGAGDLDTLSPVFFKYFPNILGAPFIGKPDYKAGTDLGYFIWSDDSGYHLRWSADGESHKFTGNIILTGGSSYADVKQIGGGITVKSPLISWDSSISGGEGGVDFKVASGQLMISAKIGEDPANPSIYASNVYLGVSKFSQQYLPIIIDAAGQRLVDVSNMGKAAESSNLERSIQTIEWDGKLDSGAYVDNGTYVVRVRAEGVDGAGVATDEAVIQVKTPFEVSNIKVDPADRKFSTLGGIDRVSVFYNVSKDAIVNADAYAAAGDWKASILKNAEVLGNTSSSRPLSFFWRGNYPSADSGLVAPGGDYKIRLKVAAKDGSESKTIELDNISIARFDQNSNIVSLSPIGEETDFNHGLGVEKIRLAAGDSPFYFTAKGSGRCHPPKDFAYTITAEGAQKISAYPFVPFAALMHRGFREVKITAKAGAQGVYAASKWDWYQWVRDKDTSFNNIDRISKNVTLTNDSFSFELSDSANSDDLFGSPTGVTQPSRAFVKLEIPISFCAQDDNTFVLDTFTIQDSDFTDGSGEARSRPSDKGIFKITFIQNPAPPTEFQWVMGRMSTNNPETVKFLDEHPDFKRLLVPIPNDYNYRENEFNYRYRIKVELASPIPYSRLTNRFFPWIGFVDAKVSVNEKQNFTGYLNQLDKLGFPGKSYFMGTSSKGETAPHRGQFDLSLSSSSLGGLVATLSKIGNLDVNAPNVADIKAKTDTRLSGTASDYTTYLADEYLEFVPITSPLLGKFEYNGSIVNGKTALPLNQASYPFIAKTDLTFPADGDKALGIESPFSFPWPWKESEKIAFDEEQNITRKKLDKDLGGNPQNYTGTTPSGTWWELDESQINQRKINQKASQIGSGQVRFDKSRNKSVWNSKESLGQILSLPDYVREAQYSVTSNTAGIKINPNGKGKNDSFSAEDMDTQGQAWTTADDANLTSSDGLIRSQLLTFNPREFRGKRAFTLSLSYPLNQSDYTSAGALQYTFLKYDPFGRDMISTPIDNPNLIIDNWEVKIKDRTDGDSKDLQLQGGVQRGDKRLNDAFTIKLKLDAVETRYVEIFGSASGAYELLYFDGNTWKTILHSDEGKTGRLAWWDVSRLNGKYTVMLRSGGFISTQDVSIGTLIRKDLGGEAYSAYKRAELKFPAGAFRNSGNLPQDQLVTITPVSMNEIYIRNRPIIITTGPIVEIKPSPWKFRVSTLEGVDERPTLRFVYTFEDLADPKLAMWDLSKPLPSHGANLGLPMNIHQVTAAGDLQIVSGNKQEVEINNGEHQYVFYAALDHFSTYALLPGKFSLSAPIVLADRYITNKGTVTLYGTAEPGSIVGVKMSRGQGIKEDLSLGTLRPGDLETLTETSADFQGNFRFENVTLAQEGSNRFFITSHPKDNTDVMTYSDVKIIKDTVPPSAEASQNLYAFSPNGDGKYDLVDYLLKSNEAGKIYLSASSAGGSTRQLLNQEISAEAGKEIKLTWGKDSFRIFRRDNATGQWVLCSETPISEKLADGVCHTTIYAIDEAGNISNNISNTTILDTTPPVILGLDANPNPFTPNDDGVKDTTKIWYKFSEPAYAITNIYRGDEKLFRTHEGPTADFKYPTLKAETAEQKSSSGEWLWDGRGSRGELMGGEYSYSIIAEDNVGNRITSEAKPLSIDCAPSLIPYVYAEPDPFSPVSGNNNFTEIKYYLSRDNLKVNLAVMGAEGKTIKRLVEGAGKKGEQLVRWYGDFDPDYEGSRAVDNKYRVGDGQYEYLITAEDPDGGAPAQITNTVLVDNTPPYISLKPLAVDYPNKQVKVTFNLPETASLEAAVYDAENKLIETLTRETQLAGEHIITYSLPPNPSSLTRYIKLTATDRAQNSAERTTEAFSIAPNQLQIVSHGAKPPTFTPNGDGSADTMLISYVIAGGALPYKVSVKILNGTGAAIAELIKDETQTAGAWSCLWIPGYLNALIPDGIYTYEISAEDKLGSMVNGQSSIVVVSSRPTVSLSLSDSVFSPNNDGAKDAVTFNYSIDYPTFYITGEALVKLEVQNISGEAVWSKTMSHTPGSYSYEWDGTLMPGSLGTLIPDGNYFLKISAQDALGTLALPQTLPLTVNRDRPEKTLFEISPNHFSPNGDGRKDAAVINFGWSKPARVSVSVKDSGGKVVATLINNQPMEAYNPSVSLAAKSVKAFSAPLVKWDGGGVKDGVYTIEIIATDEAGNSNKMEGQAVVDTLAPEAPNYAALLARTNRKEQTIKGAAEAGSRVSLYNNEQLVKTVSTEGIFSIPLNLVPGENRIKLQTEDAAGNLSLFSSSVVNHETELPAISNIQITPNPAKEGQVSISFSVSETLESDPTVTVNGNIVSRFTIRDSRDYEYQYEIKNGEKQGMAEVSIGLTDLAGNNAEYSLNDLLVIDLEAPEHPVLSELPAHTNIGKRWVSGSAEAGSKIRVYNNNILAAETTCENNGCFNAQIDLSLGDNQIKVISEDSSGNISEVSQPAKVIYDTSPPALSNLKAIPLLAKTGQVKLGFSVSETLEAVPAVTVNGNVVSHFTIHDSQNYECQYEVKKDEKQGSAEVKVSLLDLAGNEASQTYAGLFSVDTIAPDKPLLNSAPKYTNQENLAVSGTTEKGTKVYFYLNGQPAGETAARSDGEFSIQIKLAEGNNSISVQAQDAAGNISLSSLSQAVILDQTPPRIKNLDVTAENSKSKYAGAGEIIKIDFDVDKELKADPAVMFGDISISLLEKEILSESQIRYAYRYTVAPEDAEGSVPAEISIEDLAGNEAAAQGEIVIDKTPPKIKNITASPNPARAGEVQINFAVEELNSLQSAPTLEVKLNGSKYPYTANQTAANFYQVKHTVSAGENGEARITVGAADAARNTASASSEFSVDTAAPVFSAVRCETPQFHEGAYYARGQTPVDIYFSASEALKYNPEVAVSGQRAAYADLIGGEYHYQYTVDPSTAVEGAAKIGIAGSDLAGNTGELETGLLKESFVIDITTPEAQKVVQAGKDLVASPSFFATNSDPDGDVPRSTSLHYRLKETARTTLSIHKLPNSGGDDYKKEDFSSGNRVIVLLTNVWQAGGVEQYVSWDGAVGGGYAAPGKYAYIIKAQDAAGNVTEIKYGGTFWIQDNALKISPPDQIKNNNPDPAVVSPFGNSQTAKSASLYFKINLGITPKEVFPSRWISAMDVGGDIDWDKVAGATKKVGRYQLKVFSEAGALVYISSEKDARSGMDIVEKWEGIDQNGQPAPNGRYKMLISLKDFRGQPAFKDELGERWVTVDNDAPKLSSLSASPYYFAPGDTNSAAKSTALSYVVDDNSGAGNVTIAVYKGSGLVKTLLDNSSKQNAAYSQNWDGSLSSGFAGTKNNAGFADGIYTFKISAVDAAGNTAESAPIDVCVDTVSPAIGMSGQAATVWYGGNNPINAGFTDANFLGYKWQWDSWPSADSGGAHPENAGTTYHPAEGEKILYIRSWDTAGNRSDIQYAYKRDASPPSLNANPAGRTWTNTNITAVLSAADALSGLNSSQYAWSAGQTPPGSSWSNFSNGGGVSQTQDGSWYLHLRAEDAAKNTTTKTFGPYQKDAVLPTITFGGQAADTWYLADNPITINLSDAGGSGYRGFKWAWDSWPADDPNGCNPSASGSTTHGGQGSRTLYVRAWDGAGNAVTASKTYYRDSIAPDISGLSNKTFNPYVDGSARVDFTASDPAPSSGFSPSNITAKVMSGTQVVRNLVVNSNSGGSYYVVWDGMNDSGDYVNEGDYALQISAVDGVGNLSAAKTSTFFLRDDQRITNNAADSNSPYLTISGNALTLKWVEGKPDDTAKLGPVELYLETSSPLFGDTDATNTSGVFTLDHNQNVDLYLEKDGPIAADRCDYSINRASDGVAVWSRQNFQPQGGVNLTAWLSAGTYYLRVRIGASGGWHTAKSWMKVWWYDRKYNQYTCTSSNLGQTWGGASGPEKVDSYSTGPMSVGNHSVKVENNRIWYKRGSSNWVRVTNDFENKYYPAIVTDSSGNAYITWQDKRDGNYEIYFQKIPYNFAPVKGTVSAAAIKNPSAEQIMSSIASTLEAPVLISPENDKQNVSSIRPTFEWRHNRGSNQLPVTSNQLPVTSNQLSGTSYQLDIAKNDAFSIARQSFAKSANSGTPDKTDPNLYCYNYSIHEFDPGLEQDTYYWKVTAIASSEAATSEVWSFKVAPDLTLSGITNYPNPFNPNKESTKIRYRLSTDADEVVIRIYDVIGSLVTELSGTTIGEKASIWEKYNDVIWDGRNGRGDIVVNGIYPFEVTAKLGERTLRGRGKAAVLK